MVLHFLLVALGVGAWGVLTVQRLILCAWSFDERTNHCFTLVLLIMRELGLVVEFSILLSLLFPVFLN